jgi:hypothetical protein
MFKPFEVMAVAVDCEIELYTQGQQNTPKGKDCKTRHGDDDFLSL